VPLRTSTREAVTASGSPGRRARAAGRRSRAGPHHAAPSAVAPSRRPSSPPLGVTAERTHRRGGGEAAPRPATGPQAFLPTAWYGSLHLNTRYRASAAARRRTACHELGHSFGLEHRRTGRTCMRDGFTTMYGHPDGTDYANLRRIYARL
jgi:hypothetical protein